MNWYSIAEIKEDVKLFEGFDVVEDVQVPLVFLAKYSDHYRQPLSGHPTAADFEERFRQFMSAHGRPQCDIDPQELEEYGVYYIDDLRQPAKLFARYTEHNYTTFKANALPPETLCWFLISKDYEVLATFEKKLSA